MNAIGAFLLALITWAAILGAFWLLPAGLLPEGTWEWHRGLWAVGFVSIIQAVGAAYFRVNTPTNSSAREPDADQQDKTGWRSPLVDGIGIFYGAAFFIFIPLDVFHFHLLPRPALLISSIGGFISILGVIVMLVAIAGHVAALRLQDQQGQRVIDTGLYGVIRHPMYLGALLWLSGAALWLESFAALIASLGVVAFILMRIAFEEAYMRKNLPGYEDYTNRVRNRLVPFVL